MDLVYLYSLKMVNIHFWCMVDTSTPYIYTQGCVYRLQNNLSIDIDIDIDIESLDIIDINIESIHIDIDRIDIDIDRIDIDVDVDIDSIV